MTDIFLRQGEPNPADVRLRDTTVSIYDTLSAATGVFSVAGQDAIFRRSTNFAAIAQRSAPPLVAVEIDLSDGAATKTLRLVNRGPLLAEIDGVRVQFDARLLLPVQLGGRISAEQYGQAIRGAPNGGLIEFALDQTIWPWLSYSWQGRTFRVYEGIIGDSFGDLVLVYEGRVSDLSFDLGTAPKASIKTTDASLDLDIPLVAGVYSKFASLKDLADLTVGVLDKAITGDTTLTQIESASPSFLFSGVLTSDVTITFPAGFTGLAQIANKTTGGFSLVCGLAIGAPITVAWNAAVSIYCGGASFVLADGSTAQTVPAALAGLPKPRLWGEAFSIAPVLEVDDGDTQTYRISTTALAEVIEVTVGGIAWDNVTGTPGAGEWSVNLDAGTIQLGSVTLGSEVRCHARAVGWGTLTSAKLIEDIATEAGAKVDATSMADFAIAAPQLVGYYATTSPLNTLTVLDEIAAGIVGWWQFGPDAKIRAGVLAAPAATAATTLTKVGIATFQLTQLDPPARRIRIEFARNWQPLTTALSGVTDAEKSLMTAPGLNAEVYDNAAILTSEPRSVDVPLIRSLVLNETDAIAIRDRASAAWGVKRQIYDLTCWDDPPALYDTIEVDFQAVSGKFRVHSAVRSIGGGATALQLWGSAVPFVAAKKGAGGSPLFDVVSYLTDDSGNILLDDFGNRIRA